jgi:cation transport regulator ChaB
MKKSELPSTLKRSPAKAQRTYIKTHDSAVEQYGDGERAHRAAYASLKHSYQKVGNRWQRKDRKGPSDPRDTKSTAEKRLGKGETFGGVDYYGNTKAELYERAKQQDIEGRSKMSKRELARALGRKG